MSDKLKKLNTNALIVFVKNPVQGKVKTRLAASIGDTYAVKVYLKLLDITREVTTKVKANRFLYYGSEIGEDNWSNEFYSKHVQKGADLGERMSSAFREVFRSNNKVVIIGSDCPSVTAELIEEAYSKLELADVVIGPSEDAGYYLLGMNNYYPELFNGIEWSTETVLPQTISAIKRSGLLFTRLHQLNDIDTIDDLRQFPDLIPDQLDLTSL